MIRFLLALLLCLAVNLPARAQAALDYDAFAALPVLHEGRIKPLDALARVELRKIYGAESIRGLGATQWLARVLFDPSAAAQDKIFTLRDPDIRKQLGVDRSPDRLFSLNDLATGLGETEALIPGLLQSKEKLTPPQAELLRLHEAALTLAQLMGAVNMILPLDGPGAGDNAPDWLTLRKEESALTRKVQSIIARKGRNPEKYSDDEKLLTLTAMQMDMLGKAGENNVLFRIVPPQWSQDGEWLSPWMTLLGGHGSPEGAEYLQVWKTMADAYRDGDAAGWEKATHKAQNMVAGHTDATRLRLEVAYRHVQPLYLAETLYTLAFAFLAASFWRSRAVFYKLALGCGAAGAILHFGGIAVRIFILARPPVGTLYESLTFVGLTIVLFAMMIELVRRDRLALLAGLGGALALLYAAPVFAPAGDSLEVLVAVLNTSFWLATHVLCITIGYGVSILAAVIAHFALLRPDLKLDSLLHKVLVTALFFTAFGTMLGGIWADQSWGRFWGWDPKENGALLIVIWIAWVLHGKYGGYLRGVTYRVAAAYLNVIVALAWFGVNLLNVGLHSYGFTGEMAAGLFAFCAFETGLLALALFQAKKGESAA